MKALILSGGAGTRLRPFSHSMPKQLIPVANVPVLEHVLRDVRALGVTEVGIVVGAGGAQIATALGDGSRLGLRLTYIEQDEPRGLAHTVQLGRDFLGEDDFVMYLGDNMLPDGVADIAGAFTARRPAAHLVLRKVADPRSFGVAELAADGAVFRLVEKPREPRSNLAVVGVYFFTAAIHEAVDAIEPSARGELEITDAIQWLVDQGTRVEASEYDGYWKDTGRVEDVLECNRHLLDRQRPSVAGEVDDRSVLTGNVVIEAGVRVSNSKIVGPVIVGAGTVIEDSLVGPYVSVGQDCRLTQTRLVDSITLDGASIAQVGELRGSLIGRSATIGVGTATDGHLRLVVGDDTRIEVAA